MATQTVFERHETKLSFPQAQFPVLWAALASWFEQDIHGLHTICSLYYDTEDFYFARRQMDKPKYREKLRLRSYGIPKAESTVYLELKKKYEGVTHKRRMPLTYAEAAAYMQHNMPPLYTGQIFGEIDWFKKQYRPVPKSVICYDRIALVGREDENLRITFDQNIRFRNEALELSKGDWGSPLAARDTILMEVKTPGAMPIWLSRILSHQRIYPSSFSKYLNASQQIVSREVQRHAG